MSFSAPIPKLMTSELFRQGPRTLAMAAAGVSYWLSWFIVVMVLMLLKVEQLFTHYVEIRNAHQAHDENQNITSAKNLVLPLCNCSRLS